MVPGSARVAGQHTNSSSDGTAGVSSAGNDVIIVFLAIVAVFSWAFACLAFRTLLLRRDHLAFEVLDDTVLPRPAGAAATPRRKETGLSSAIHATPHTASRRPAEQQSAEGSSMCSNVVGPEGSYAVPSASTAPLAATPAAKAPSERGGRSPSSARGPRYSPASGPACGSSSIQGDPEDRDPALEGGGGGMSGALLSGPTRSTVSTGRLDRRELSAPLLGRPGSPMRVVRRTNSVRDIASGRSGPLEETPGSVVGPLTMPGNSLSTAALLSPPRTAQHQQQAEFGNDSLGGHAYYYDDAGGVCAFADDVSTDWQYRLLRDRHSLFYLGCICTGTSVAVVMLAIVLMNQEHTFDPTGALMSSIATVPVLFFYATTTLLLTLLNSWVLDGRSANVRQIPALFLIGITTALMAASGLAIFDSAGIHAADYLSAMIAAVLCIACLATLVLVIPSDCRQMRIAIGVLALALASKVVVALPWTQQHHIPNMAYDVLWGSVMVVPLMIAFVSVHWRSASSAVNSR